jgi:hypothetical protein
MKSLVLYSTIMGGFYAQSEPLDKAVAAARASVGDDAWKRGYSGSDPAGATTVAKKELNQAGIKPVEFKGELEHVSFVENHDNAGNAYPKLRIGVKNNDDQLLLSLDLKSDVAQRLLVKLDNCKPGDNISISAWPTFVERSGRQYVNHAASMKNIEGAEIPVNSIFSSEVKKQTDGIEASLKSAGIDDKKIIANAKNNKRIAAHKDLLLKIESRFNEDKTKV